MKKNKFLENIVDLCEISTSKKDGSLAPSIGQLKRLIEEYHKAIDIPLLLLNTDRQRQFLNPLKSIDECENPDYYNNKAVDFSRMYLEKL